MDIVVDDQHRARPGTSEGEGARRGWLLVLTLAAALVPAGTALAQDVGGAIRQGTQQNTQSARSQEKVDKLDDEKETLLAKYRQELAQIESLQVYNRQLSGLVASQEVERSSLQSQIERVTQVGRDVTPLMLDMIESLENFVAIDLPFLEDERSERIADLKEMMTRSDVADSEKYRRILEAFQVENEYGRSIEAYQGEIEIEGQKLLVDFLRFGRLALLYQSQDARRTGTWDAGSKAWKELPSEYRSAVREGLRIAKKQKAPDLVSLPLPAPEDAR